MLLGDEAMKQIAQKRVIIFGVGGVGSWCAESLVRSGVRRLTIVDSGRNGVRHHFYVAFQIFGSFLFLINAVNQLLMIL